MTDPREFATLADEPCRFCGALRCFCEEEDDYDGERDEDYDDDLPSRQSICDGTCETCDCPTWGDLDDE